MILVTGATGHNGSELLKTLAPRGIRIRAMLHTPEQVRTLPEGVETVIADFTDPQSIDAALDGVDRVFLVTPPSEHAAEWQINFVHAARRAGVAHIVKLSLLGADLSAPSRFQRAHRLAEQALEESGIAWTHLRPNFFMQTLTQYLQGDTLISIGGDGPLSAVDLRDAMRVAAAVLTEPGHAGRVYELTGPEALTRAEMAADFSSALGRAIQWVDLPVDQARSAMAGAGFLPWNIDGVIELNHWFQTPAAATVNDAVRRIGGRQPATVAQFAARWSGH